VDALFNGQVNVTTEGVNRYIKPALRHRLILNFEAGTDEITPEDILEKVAESVG
jgi:MoxR-like ATPase